MRRRVYKSRNNRSHVSRCFTAAGIQVCRSNSASWAFTGARGTGHQAGPPMRRSRRDVVTEMWSSRPHPESTGTRLRATVAPWRTPSCTPQSYPRAMYTSGPKSIDRLFAMANGKCSPTCQAITAFPANRRSEGRASFDLDLIVMLAWSAPRCRLEPDVTTRDAPAIGWRGRRPSCPETCRSEASQWA